MKFNLRKITIPEGWGARSFRSFAYFTWACHYITAENKVKEHTIEEKWNFSIARSLRSLAQFHILH